MTNLFRLGIAVVAGLSGVLVWGQPNANAAADQAWAELQRLAAPAPLAAATNGRSKTADEKKEEIKQQAAKARQASAGAKDFYATYPNHPKAGEARKIEALSAVRGAEGESAATVDAALGLAKTYRQTTANPAADRFDVALAQEQFAHSIKVKDRKATARLEDRKKIGDDLRAEFGDLPALETYYVELAESADATTAVTLARAVNSSSAATAATKARAQTILDRSALVGSALRLKLNKLDGSELDLAQQKNTITILIACSPNDPGALDAIKRVEKTIPKESQIIYLALGGKAADARRVQDAIPVAGTICHTGTGASAKAIFDGLKLQRGPLPRVFVLNRDGVVAGTGRVSELPGLLLKAKG